MLPDPADLPRIPYSDPAVCNPELLAIDQLVDAGRYGGPRLPDDCTAEGPYWCASLALPKSETLYLHVYKGTTEVVNLRIYGIRGDGEVLPLTDCLEIIKIARRVEVRVDAGRFDFLLVRFAVVEPADNQVPSAERRGNYFRLAAYDGVEPRSPGGVVFNNRPACMDPYGRGNQTTDQTEVPFNCEGQSFQRLILASCSPKDDVLAWADATGLEFSERYVGEAGTVVALGVPPGLDLNTTGGSAQEVKAKLHSGGGSVSPDYIVNLFSPTAPTNGGGKLYRVEEVKSVREAIPSPVEYFNRIIKPVKARDSFDLNRDPVTVTIIDSGVDLSEANANRWNASRYRGPKVTEFIRPLQLGYDFINHDYEPEDETPHGTYVAAALLAQYDADRPLQLVHMKTFGAGGISSYFGALVSIYEATAIGSKVINMSWGFYQADPPEALRCAIKTAARRGVFLVTSAGNDGKDLETDPQWPAAFAPEFKDNMLTVASYWTPESGKPGGYAGIDLMDFSNYGDHEVPMAAFMTTGVPEYQTGTLIYPLGTSISTPIVSGLLANWLADHPEGSLAEFRDAFFQRSPGISDRITDGQYLPLDNSVVMGELNS